MTLLPIILCATEKKQRRRITRKRSGELGTNPPPIALTVDLPHTAKAFADDEPERRATQHVLDLFRSQEHSLAPRPVVRPALVWQLARDMSLRREYALPDPRTLDLNVRERERASELSDDLRVVRRRAQRANL